MVFHRGRQKYKQMRACGGALFSSTEMNSVCGFHLENNVFSKPFRELVHKASLYGKPFLLWKWKMMERKRLFRKKEGFFYWKINENIEKWERVM